MYRYISILIIGVFTVSCSLSKIETEDYVETIMNETKCPNIYWSLGYYSYCTTELQNNNIDDLNYYKLHMELLSNEAMDITIKSHLEQSDSIDRIKKFICSDFANGLGIGNETFTKNGMGALQFMMEDRYFYNVEILKLSNEHIKRTEIILKHTLPDKRTMIIWIPAYINRNKSDPYNQCSVSIQ